MEASSGATKLDFNNSLFRFPETLNGSGLIPLKILREWESGNGSFSFSENFEGMGMGMGMGMGNSKKLCA